jgi:hypothetical protein
MPLNNWVHSNKEKLQLQLQKSSKICFNCCAKIFNCKYEITYFCSSAEPQYLAAPAPTFLLCSEDLLYYKDNFV